MTDDSVFEVGDWVLDTQDPENEPALVVNADAGRADEVEVGTTGSTVADFESNAAYSRSDRVVSIVFRSELERNGMNPDAVAAFDDPVEAIEAHEAKWAITIRYYDYPEPRLAPKLEVDES